MVLFGVAISGGYSVLTPVLLAGKRVIFEDHEDGWLRPAHGEPLVFVPDLWVHQFGLSAFQGYPNCNISGDSTW